MEAKEFYKTTLEKPLSQLAIIENRKDKIFWRFALGYLAVTVATWVSMHDGEAEISVSAFLTLMVYPAVFLLVFALITKDLSQKIEKNFKEGILNPCINHFIPNWHLEAAPSKDLEFLDYLDYQRKLAKTYRHYASTSSSDSLIARKAVKRNIRIIESEIFSTLNSADIKYFVGCIVRIDLEATTTGEYIIMTADAQPPDGYKRSNQIYLPGSQHAVVYTKETRNLDQIFELASLNLLIRHANWHKIPFDRIHVDGKTLSMLIPYKQRLLDFKLPTNPSDQIKHFETFRFTLQAIDDLVEFAFPDIASS